MPKHRNACAAAVAFLILAAAAFAADAVSSVSNTNARDATTPAKSPMYLGKTPHSESVTFAIGGAEDMASADILTKALRTHGLQATVQPEPGKLCEFNVTLPRSMDLSWYSHVVASAHTPQRASAPPTFDFVLFAPLTKESTDQIMDRLAHLKGVDAKASRADTEHGKLWVRINGADRVTPNDVYDAIHTAGVNARFSQFTSNAG